jgi:hypothetical protein
MNLPEFRLYYADDGTVLFYTCGEHEGNYIIVSSQTYAACRFDIKIVDKKIVSIYDTTIITKLVPDNEGISCYKNDISIIYNGNESQKWKLKHVEYN